MRYPSTIRASVGLALFSSLVLSSNLNASEVKWNQDFRQATQISAEQKKPMLVMVSAKWCGYCQKMLNTTFRDQKVIGHLNECFVPVYIDADKHEDLVEQLGVEGLPTMVILSPDRKVVKKVSGYLSASQLDGEMVKLCSHTKPVAPKLQIPVSHRVPIRAVFQGTCLVSLRDDGKLAKGFAQYASTYQGQTVWFASARHKQRFDAKPESYWPVADGVCLVSEQSGRPRVLGQPVLAMIYADRVWFFADKTCQEQFTKNPKPFIELPQPIR